MTSRQPRVDSQIAAAFDIGSNSVKMTVAERTPNGQRVLLRRSETVRLGDRLDATGRLQEDRMAAATVALKNFADEARSLGAGRLIGVATEATRKADNGLAFLDQVMKETGIELRAISGDEEAELTFAGLDPAIDRVGELLVADIGGASTELITAANGTLDSAQSLPVGSGRLTEKFVEHDPPSEDEYSASVASAKQTFAAAIPDVIDRLVVTGGTAFYAQRLAGMKSSIDVREFQRVKEEALHSDAEALAQAIDAPLSRAKVFPAGLAIVEALIELSSPKEIVLAESGIREGLIAAVFDGRL